MSWRIVSFDIIVVTDFKTNDFVNFKVCCAKTGDLLRELNYLSTDYAIEFTVAFNEKILIKLCNSHVIIMDVRKQITIK